MTKEEKSSLEGLENTDLETQLAAGAAFLEGFAQEMAGAFEIEISDETEPVQPVNRLKGLV